MTLLQFKTLYMATIESLCEGVYTHLNRSTPEFLKAHRLLKNRIADLYAIELASPAEETLVQSTWHNPSITLEEYEANWFTAELIETQRLENIVNFYHKERHAMVQATNVSEATAVVNTCINSSIPVLVQSLAVPGVRGTDINQMVLDTTAHMNSQLAEVE